MKKVAAAATIPVVPGSENVPLHRAIYEQLLADIRDGTYRPGDRLPSEADLCRRFEASRITIAKAVQGLQREGLVIRRPGSGTFVQRPETQVGYQFGLLIPELGSTEIFEPICKGIMGSEQARSHALLWGHTVTGDGERAEAAEELCQQFIAQKVSGVFFAPLEHSETKDQSNQRIVAELRQAQIPVVLLDRCYQPYPCRSPLDLVGIDNPRAGFIITQHLWRQGARRILFLANRSTASTIVERISGYYFALRQCGSKFAGKVYQGDASDIQFVQQIVEEQEPDGVVCGNDLTAAHLMRTLIAIGVRIPEQVRIVGIDDVQYAKFLPVPLTTIHQNCSLIGETAIALMLNRMQQPERPSVDIRVPFDLVVRKSCGAGL